MSLCADVPGRAARAALAAVALTAAPFVAPAAAHDPVLPPGFEIVPVPGTWDVTTNLVFAPDGTLFAVQKFGVVRVFRPDGTLQAKSFIDLIDEVNDNYDRGLLSMALSPDFVPNGGPKSWVYLVYTVSPVPGQDLDYKENDQYSFSRLTRYKATKSGGDIVAQLSSRQVLLGHQQPDGSVPDGIASLHISHSNGRIRFGTDGSLLLGTGDGAHWDLVDEGGLDLPGFDDWTHPVTGLLGPTPKHQDSGSLRSQDLRSLAGKVLRLDPATGNGLPSNPFWDGDPTSLPSRVWATGFRNCYSMSLLPGTGLADPSAGQPGTLIVGDVGQARWEELDVCHGGENFQWPCDEGLQTNAPFDTYVPASPDAPRCGAMPGISTPPSLAWHHGNPALTSPGVPHFDVHGQPVAGGFTGNCVIVGPLATGHTFPPPWEGRLFVADYGQHWIKAVDLAPDGHVLAVTDFADDVGTIVDLARNPLNGDFWFSLIDESHLFRLRYTADFTPIAIASGAPLLGPAPLSVQFTGSASHDPEGKPLQFAWNFGDGAPVSHVADPVHVYAASGQYVATLTVTDPSSQPGVATVPVSVGGVPLALKLLSPAQGATVQLPSTLPLLADVQPSDGVSWAWSVDLYHDNHVHPAVFNSTLAAPQFAIDGAHGEGLVYWRINLTVTHPSGSTATTHAFVYAQDDVHDLSGTAPPLAHVQDFAPPWSQGTCNPDMEIVRDAVHPPVGSSDPQLQWNSQHGGAQAGDDWLGLALGAPPQDTQRWVSVEFQEGLHDVQGGWWKTLGAEVRDDGTWTPVQNLAIDPPYPFALSGQPGFDGIPFQTYSLRFDPQHGDAIRLRGQPGGALQYVSCAELRARAITSPVVPHFADLQGEGTPIAKLFELVPPVPLGVGSKDIETIRNGTLPPVGSPSPLAEYDTKHNGDQGNEDWIGYAFAQPHVLTRVVFQEGLHFPDGGAFVGPPHVQVQLVAGGPWTHVSGSALSPAYVGLSGPSYASYVIDFDPVLALGVRLDGAPAGTRRYISVGELQAQGPALPAGCGFIPYGEGLGGSNTLQLAGPTPAALGLPALVTVQGATRFSTGYLGLSPQSTALPVFHGTLLLHPQTLLLIPIGYDGLGHFAVSAMLPSDPLLAGATLNLQAFAFGQPAPWPVRMSNGLSLTLCAW